MVSRRNFLAGAAGLGLAPSFVLAETADDGYRVVRARSGELRLLEEGSATTPVWTFSETVIRARQGEELKLRFINELDRDIWLHWFGVRGPSELMTLQLRPGAGNSTDCAFTPPDAGTFWFGPLTGASRQRDMGLYGMLIVEERQAIAGIAGIADVALIVDDWQLSNDGAIEENFGDMEAAVGEGRLGNWFTVNSTYRPEIALAPGKASRLRLLNAANVRTMGILFKGADPLLLALDGQPIAPRQLGSTALTLAPGQRCDLLILEGDPSATLALDLFEDIVELAFLVRKGDAPLLELPDNFALPPNPIASTADLDNPRVFPLVIDGGAKGGMTSARFRGETLDLRALLENGMAWAFNGTAGLAAEPFASVENGETVILEVDNRTAFAQPLHIHGHVWREVDRAGVALEGEPWRDTAVVAARQTAKLVFVADNTGTWVIQSLVAERADAGLVTAFAVS